MDLDVNLIPSSSITSLVDLDLNLLPDAAASTAITSMAMKIPKLEPKPDSFNEGLASSHSRQTTSHPQKALFLSPNCLQSAKVPETNPRFLTPLEQASALGPYTRNLFSEYNRISELFNTAFSGNSVLESDSRAALESGAKKKFKRSSQLVRVTDLGFVSKRCFQDVIRKTRMLFNALMNLSATEEEKRLAAAGPEAISVKRLRSDLKASAILKDRNMWLSRDKRIVGAIPGIYIGDLFFFRMELCVIGLHGQLRAGIDYVLAAHSSNGEPIATSIIVSGGYSDNEDNGDVIIYTGHGGLDKLNKQCSHQKLEGGNLGLERSMHYGIEVRVIRGIKQSGSISSNVYVYDGLYKILACWFHVGKSGFGVYKYELVRIKGQPEMGSSILKYAENLRTRPLESRPTGYLSLDISGKKENFPVMLFNDIDGDQEPLNYDYLVRTVFPPIAYQQSGNETGCGCVSSCGKDCICVMKNGGEFPFDQNGILLKGKPAVFECGRFCRCPPQCRNRVTQHGLRSRLEVFRSRETGWGVRSLDIIQAGAFICEYTGVILTREQAHVLSMNGDNFVYSHKFPDRCSEWGDLSQIYPDNVRPSFPQMPPLDFAIDVSKMRNVACYMTHSMNPNVMVQFVLYDHNNLMFPHIMLFAMETIPPLRELSLDYGMGEEWRPNKSRET